MINIQIPEEDIVKLAELIKKSDPPFTIASLIGMLLNIIFVLTLLFMLGVL